MGGGLRWIKGGSRRSVISRPGWTGSAAGSTAEEEREPGREPLCALTIDGSTGHSVRPQRAAHDDPVAQRREARERVLGRAARNEHRDTGNGLADATQHLEYDASFAQDQLGHDDTRCKPGQIDGTFDADRPFLYIIRDRPTGVVLFVGRVVDPR